MQPPLERTVRSYIIGNIRSIWIGNPGAFLGLTLPIISERIASAHMLAFLIHYCLIVRHAVWVPTGDAQVHPEGPFLRQVSQIMRPN